MREIAYLLPLLLISFPYQTQKNRGRVYAGYEAGPGAVLRLRQAGSIGQEFSHAPFQDHGSRHRRACFVCHLPKDGAVAVLCDECIQNEIDPKFAVAGFADMKQRVPITELKEPFEHDELLHTVDNARPQTIIWLPKESAEEE